MDIESWNAQLRKGAAEFIVLALLEAEARSGVALLDAVSGHTHVGLSDGTLYPLLRRLERDGRIAGTWEEARGKGRAMKVYRLTQAGRAALKQMRFLWAGFSHDVAKLTGDSGS